ncbi:MAG: iron-sulfur cluster assembly scaffold protein [Verrucomicrobiota bacterium]|nr:iron-sulfur cluster assembly scaffold protein [Verrucomicrobiota bacterium]
MAKTDLIGGVLWEQYSDKVVERMNNPENFGEISQEEADKAAGELIIADHGAESCGDAVRLFWLVDPETDKIIKATFKSFGCGTAIAATDMMTEMCLGKTVDEVLEITNVDVEAELRDAPDEPAVPPQKMHCSVMAYDVIKVAAALYKGIDLSEIENENIVCPCAQVSLGTIEDAIKNNDLKTVEEITNYTKAGGFCKSCIKPGGHEKRKYYLVDILEKVRKEMEKHDPTSKVDFEDMSIVAKVKAVDKILSDEILPILAGDGGSVELLNITEDKSGVTQICISYSGACKACPSSHTGTLQLIQKILREKLSDQITVKVK